MEIRMDALAPQRSRTDPAATESKLERPHKPRRLRATSFRTKGQHDEQQHQHHHHRRHAKDVVQSAIDSRPPISIDTLLRRDKRSPSPSKRRTSSEQHQPPADVEPATPAIAEVTAQDVEKIRRENERREEELRSSLKSAEDVAMSSTRQLDDTYYSILEKASILRSTVQSLQQLAEESKRMHKQFEEDTQTLEKETQSTLSTFNDFSQQETSINELVQRLQSSRSQTDQLNERLESARHRVEAFEQRENEKEANRRKRWRFIWGTLAAVVVLVVAILVARNRRAVGLRMNEVGQKLNALGDAVEEEVVVPLQSRLRPSPSEDPALRKMFDEL